MPHRGRLISGAAARMLIAGVIGSSILAGFDRSSAQVTAPKYRFQIDTQVAGAANAIEVDQGVAFLGLGPRLVTLDVADAAKPQWLGYSEMMPGVVYDLAVARDHAFVLYRDGYPVNGRDGLMVFNVAEPRQPRLVGHVKLSLVAHGISIEGRHAYVVGNVRTGDIFDTGPDDAMSIFDVADPERPVEVGRLTVAEDPTVGSVGVDPIDILMLDGRAYVSRTILFHNNTEIQAYSLANPAAPALARKTDLPGLLKAWSADPIRQYLYVVTVEPDFDNPGPATLRIYDVSSAERIRSIGALALGESSLCAAAFPGRPDERAKRLSAALAVRAGRVYYIDPCGRRLQVVDVADPGRARIIASPPFASNAVAAAWRGQSLLVANGPFGGLTTLDVRAPDSPAMVANVSTVGALDQLALVGDRLYGSNPQGGLVVVDPASLDQAPWAPPVGRLDILQAGDLAATEGQLIAGVVQPPSLRAFDLSEPDQPRQTESLTLPEAPRTIAAAGRRVGVSMDNQGLMMFNLGAAGLVADGLIPGAMRGFAFDERSGEIVVDRQGAYLVVDAANLAVRRTLSHPVNDDKGIVGAMDALNGKAYLGIEEPSFGLTFSYGEALVALDLAGGDVARVIGRVDRIVGDRAGRVIARDDSILLASERQLGVLPPTLPRFSKPSAPEFTAQWASPGSGADMVWLDGPKPNDPLAGAQVFLADGDGGLSVLSLIPERVPTSFPTATPTRIAKRTATATVDPSRLSTVAPKFHSERRPKFHRAWG